MVNKNKESTIDTEIKVHFMKELIVGRMYRHKHNGNTFLAVKNGEKHEHTIQFMGEDPKEYLLAEGHWELIENE